MEEKRIQIDDNRVLIYSIDNDYAKHVYTIKEFFLDNGDVVKSYSFSQWDDYGFNGWSFDNDIANKVSFEFDINHPIYMSLFHLLNYDDELLIEDDNTMVDNKKYLLVYRKEKMICVDFIDEVTNCDCLNKKFYVFIKNIGPDCRSKIDQKYKDTKVRLLNFFQEVYYSLLSNYHQNSFEEYFLNICSNEEINDMKKVFKRNI